MSGTNKGVYENGKIIFPEEPPFKKRTDVIVTFLTGKEQQSKPASQKIIFGILEGKIKIPDDFDEPLDDLKDYM